MYVLESMQLLIIYKAHAIEWGKTPPSSTLYTSGKMEASTHFVFHPISSEAHIYSNI